MPSIHDVKDWLAKKEIRVLEFEEPTPTAETAAAAVGCTPAEIAKSILFIVGGEALMVVTAGDVKVKSSLLKKATGRTGKVKLPQADQVEELTGYSPGGVCPFLLPATLPVYVDSSMRRFETVYAAAGNANSAVPVTVDQLLDATGGEEISACEPLG